jgi:hypothetical protein
MCKAGYKYFAAALSFVVLALLVLLPSGAGPGALDREMAFTGGLHNSLYYLDLAKQKWAEEKRKSDGDVPTIADLTGQTALIVLLLWELNTKSLRSRKLSLNRTSRPLPATYVSRVSFVVFTLQALAIPFVVVGLFQSRRSNFFSVN